MATTSVDLFRALTGDLSSKYKNLEVGVYPGDGVLDPRWEPTKYLVKRTGEWRTGRADVVIDPSPRGPEVRPGGGTSLHDVAGWFPNKDFWIPAGTEYSDELYIKPGKKKEISAYTGVEGTHYQIEVRKPMSILSFQGHLNNMARAAIVQQCKLAEGKKTI